MAEKLVNKAGLEEFASKVKEKMVFVENPTSGQVSKSLIDLFYPVGCYFETSDSSFDPNTAWGGTWVEDSYGKVTVAYQNGDTNFGTVGQTGGEKTHTLTTQEMPSHTHSCAHINTDYHADLGQPSAWHPMLAQNIDDQTGFNTNATSTGGDGAHNNLQPYIVVKRWHRTA